MLGRPGRLEGKREEGTCALCLLGLQGMTVTYMYRKRIRVERQENNLFIEGEGTGHVPCACLA